MREGKGATYRLREPVEAGDIVVSEQTKRTRRGVEDGEAGLGPAAQVAKTRRTKTANTSVPSSQPRQLYSMAVAKARRATTECVKQPQYISAQATSRARPQGAVFDGGSAGAAPMGRCAVALLYSGHNQNWRNKAPWHCCTAVATKAGTVSYSKHTNFTNIRKFEAFEK